MPRPRSLMSAVAAVVAASGLAVVPAAPAAASATCPSQYELDGTVETAVYESETHWWHHDSNGASAYVLRPYDSRMQLEVRTADCNTFLCGWVTATATDPGVCEVAYTGPVQVGVSSLQGDPGAYYGYQLTETTLQSTQGPYPSQDCAQGPTLVAAHGAGSAVRVGAYSPDADTTWLCVQAQGAPGQAVGGKLVVDGPGLDLSAARVDEAYGACASPGSTVPDQHPVNSGTLLNQPYLIDAHTSADHVWLCVRYGATGYRVLLEPQAGAGQPDVAYHADAPGGSVSTSVPSGPSGSCERRGATAAEATVAGVRTYSSLYWPTLSGAELCFRTEGGPVRFGGVLHLPLGVADLPVRSHWDTSPCTYVLYQTGGVLLSMTPPGQSPVSVCVGYGTPYPTRYELGELNPSVPQPPSFTPDPDNTVG